MNKGSKGVTQSTQTTKSESIPQYPEEYTPIAARQIGMFTDVTRPMESEAINRYAALLSGRPDRVAMAAAPKLAAARQVGALLAPLAQRVPGAAGPLARRLEVLPQRLKYAMMAGAPEGMGGMVQSLVDPRLAALLQPTMKNISTSSSSSSSKGGGPGAFETGMGAATTLGTLALVGMAI